MNYQEYCELFLGENELAEIITNFVRIESSRKCPEILYERLEHFCKVQHWASLMAYGFRYIGPEEGHPAYGVVFEWKDEITFGGPDRYNVRFVVSADEERPYAVRAYDSPSDEDFSEETFFKKCSDAVIRVLSLVGCDHIQNGLKEIPEPDEETGDKPDFPTNIINVDELCKKDEKRVRKRVKFMMRNVMEKMKASGEKWEIIDRTFKYVRRILDNTFSSYLHSYIRNITFKNGNVRVMFFDESIKRRKLSINVMMSAEPKMDVILTEGIETTNGKNRFQTDSMEDVMDVISDYFYGVYRDDDDYFGDEWANIQI